MSPICRLQRVFTPESKGIESLPQLPSFEDMPCCDISEIGPLNLSKSIFGKSESVITLKMNPEKIPFSSPNENQFFELNGRGHGSASTVLRPYTLAVVSQVWELTSINSLTISISDDGMTNYGNIRDKIQLRIASKLKVKTYFLIRDEGFLDPKRYYLVIDFKENKKGEFFFAYYNKDEVLEKEYKERIQKMSNLIEIDKNETFKNPNNK